MADARERGDEPSAFALTTSRNKVLVCVLWLTRSGESRKACT